MRNLRVIFVFNLYAMFCKGSACKCFDVSLTFIFSNFHYYFVVAPIHYGDKNSDKRPSSVKFKGILDDVYNLKLCSTHSGLIQIM